MSGGEVRVSLDDIRSLIGELHSLHSRLNILSKLFRHLDPPLSEWMGEVALLSRAIVDKARGLLDFEAERAVVEEPSNVHELLEMGRECIERALNLTVGSDPRMFFVWSLRLITRGYLEAYYPWLKGQELDDMSEVLGLDTVVPVAELGSKELFRDYELLGYRDVVLGREESTLARLEAGAIRRYGELERVARGYCGYHVWVSDLPLKEYLARSDTTLGGMLCCLSVLLWSIPEKSKLKGVVYDLPKVRDQYLDEVDRVLKESEWSNDHIICMPSHPRDCRGRISFTIIGITAELSLTSHYKRKEPFMKFLDYIMPPQILGLVETGVELGTDGSVRGEVLVRAKGYG